MAGRSISQEPDSPDFDVLVDLIRVSAPELEIREVVPVLEGWDSIVLEVNGEWIFRFPRRPDVVAQHEKERRLLPALAPTLPVSTPEFTYFGTEDSPFLGYRRIEGVPLNDVKDRSGDMPRIAGQLAAFLTALHSFSVETAVALGIPEADVGGWRDSYMEMYDFAAERVRLRVPQDIWEHESRVWRDFLGDDDNFAFELSLVHADLGSEHMMFNNETGDLVGVIDWGDAAIGDPALDLVGIDRSAGRTLTRQVVHQYSRDLGPNLWNRINFYSRVSPYYGVRYGLDEGKPEFVANSLSSIIDRVSKELVS